MKIQKKKNVLRIDMCGALGLITSTENKQKKKKKDRREGGRTWRGGREENTEGIRKLD